MTNVNADEHGAGEELAAELEVEEVSTQLRINLAKDV